MGIVLEEFVETHRPAVQQFNRRIAETLEPGMELPEHPALDWLPKGPHPRIYQEPFVALEHGVGRGGYVLKHQEFAVNGEIHRIASYRLPISEGLVDRKYAALGLQFLRD